MTNLNVTKISDIIYAYNIIENPDYIVEKLKNGRLNPQSSVHLSNWEPWHVFGNYLWNFNNQKYDSGNETSVEERNIIEYIKNTFYQTTKLFLEDHGIQPDPSWILNGPVFCQYHANQGGLRVNIGGYPEGYDEYELAMVYHTDYVYTKRFEKGLKNLLTCTMYLNDDYGGGDLRFKVNNDWFNYKPKAGDVVIFPSGHPELLSEKGIVMHGVGAVRGAEKYMIRTFYAKDSEGFPQDEDGKIMCNPFYGQGKQDD